MSKKSVFLVSIVAASAIIAGCTTVVKDNTLKAVQLTPHVQGVPMIAELEVSPIKVKGEAKGKVPSKKELEKEAVAEALKLTNSDVLVGANFFYEYVDNVNLTVTVIGYPANYVNFKPKPKEVSNNEEILIGGTFFYEDGSKNQISATIKNPKQTVPVHTPAPAAVQPPANIGTPENPTNVQEFLN